MNEKTTYEIWEAKDNDSCNVRDGYCSSAMIGYAPILLPLNTIVIRNHTRYRITSYHFEMIRPNVIALIAEYLGKVDRDDDD